MHAREVHKSHVTEQPSVVCKTGEIVTREVGGGAHPTDPAEDNSFDGIVPKLKGGDHIAEHARDFREGGLKPFHYDPERPEEFMFMPIQPVEGGAQFSPYTLDDESQPAPAIERNANVGIITLDGEQQVVEEGYVDAGGVEYSEGGAGDFMFIGTADKVAHGTIFDEYDKRVRIRLPVNY